MAVEPLSPPPTSTSDAHGVRPRPGTILGGGPVTDAPLFFQTADDQILAVDADGRVGRASGDQSEAFRTLQHLKAAAADHQAELARHQATFDQASARLSAMNDPNERAFRLRWMRTAAADLQGARDAWAQGRENRMTLRAEAEMTLGLSPAPHSGRYGRLDAAADPLPPQTTLGAIHDLAEFVRCGGRPAELCGGDGLAQVDHAPQTFVAQSDGQDRQQGFDLRLQRRDPLFIRLLHGLRSLLSPRASRPESRAQRKPEA